MVYKSMPRYVSMLPSAKPHGWVFYMKTLTEFKSLGTQGCSVIAHENL
jgi:hypothetical protein